MAWQQRVAGLLGASSIGAGAFGAHGMAGRSEEYRAIWKTAVQYHQVHALALLATASVPSLRARTAASACLVAGVGVFCGSNYLVAWHEDVEEKHAAAHTAIQSFPCKPGSTNADGQTCNANNEWEDTTPAS